jgi:membrane protein implicated in regulation of membrane protease activity
VELNDAETWRWIWLVAALMLAVSELAIPGSFFMLSFSAGAVVATIAAFAGADVGVQWLTFVIGSGVALGLLVPLGRRLNAAPNQSATGAFRWHGSRGVVLDRVPGGGTHETGLVRVQREEWRAESANSDAIEAGTSIRVVRIEGTRLIVTAADDDTATPTPESGSTTS